MKKKIDKDESQDKKDLLKAQEADKPARQPIISAASFIPPLPNGGKWAGITVEWLQMVAGRKAMELAVSVSRECEQEPRKKDQAPHVGAAVVDKQGNVLEAAYRGELKPGEHAEYTLLERKLKDVDLNGATLYTTLEPCTDRNPPKISCADRVIARGISHVVIGILDPNPDICGVGQIKLRKAGIKVSHFDHGFVELIEKINEKFSNQFDINAKLKRFREMKELGPNGYPVGKDDEGNKVEWVPDAENPSKNLGVILRRNDKAISDMREKLWEQMWWRYYQDFLMQPELGKASEGTKAYIEEIEKRHGKDFLEGLSEYEWGIRQGQLLALLWVLGKDDMEST